MFNDEVLGVWVSEGANVGGKPVGGADEELDDFADLPLLEVCRPPAAHPLANGPFFFRPLRGQKNFLLFCKYNQTYIFENACTVYHSINSNCLNVIYSKILKQTIYISLKCILTLNYTSSHELSTPLSD